MQADLQSMLRVNPYYYTPVYTSPVVSTVPRQTQNVNIADQFETYGNNNNVLIASQNNGANKNINLAGGFISAGDNTNIQIGLQNLLLPGQKSIQFDGPITFIDETGVKKLAIASPIEFDNKVDKDHPLRIGWLDVYPHLLNLNEESNLNGHRSTYIGDQVSNNGNGNGFKIGASAETSENTFGKRYVTLNRGLNSQGDGNSFVIGLQNLGQDENSQKAKITIPAYCREENYGLAQLGCYGQENIRRKDIFY